MLRKLFGVSRRTHEAQRVRIRELNAIVESLRRKNSSETKGKLRFEGLYKKEREDHNSCARERKELHGERETLMAINRNLAKELHRVRELFMVAFTSKRARELVLQYRQVHLRHLSKLTGKGNRFTAKQVTLAMNMARQEAERGPDGKTEA